MKALWQGPGSSVLAFGIIKGDLVAAAILTALAFMGAPRAAEDLPLPLTGPAYALAEQAFEAYAAGEYERAIAKARETLRQRPDAIAVMRLLVLSLASSGQWSAADQTASRFIESGIQDQELMAMRDRIRAQLRASAPPSSPPVPGPRAKPDPAYRAATLAYQAIERGDYPRAVELAREAVRLAPSKADYHGALISALLGADRFEETVEAASQALVRWPSRGAWLALRGDARQRLGQHDLALSDYRAALEDPNKSRAQERQWRLAAADAGMAARVPEQALAVLDPLDPTLDPAVSARRGAALLALERLDPALQAFSSARIHASEASERARLWQAELAILADLGRMSEARQGYRAALAAGDLEHLTQIERAYLAARLGEDEQAWTAFVAADQAGQLRPEDQLNAAYLAKRLARNEQSLELFKAAIDAQADSPAPWDSQRRFEIKREVAELSRRWGGSLSLNYGGVGVSPSTTLQPPVTATGGDILQAGLELYWRPPHIGMRDGRVIELFGRVFETLSHTGTGGVDAATGEQTRQGALGVRWKPLSRHNLVLETGRLIKIGDQARDDWLLRAAYSTGQGSDLRLDQPSWWQWSLYGELVSYPSSQQSLMNLELRGGRAYRLPLLDERLVVSPYLVIGGGYDDALQTPGAFGAGSGVSSRLWLREDRYHAPMSYLDLSLQYRFRLLGDDRAEGIFLTFTLAY